LKTGGGYDMTDCHDMKVGQIYTCPDCGLELKVVKECKCTDESCGCGDGGCGFSCCGDPMKLKE
jgi:hypothetical protein